MYDEKKIESISLKHFQSLIDAVDKPREQIAQEVGMDASTITKYYNGNRNLSVSAIRKFANYFNVSSDYLLGFSDVKTNDKDLQAICDYTKLSVEAVKKLHGYGVSIPINYPLNEHTEEYQNYAKIVRSLYIKCKNDFIASNSFDDLLLCVFYDKLLSKNLERLKIKIETKSFEENTNGFERDMDKYILFTQVDNWSNKHRLNLFNAQDAVISFIKEYTGIDKLDKAMYNSFINNISEVIPFFKEEDEMPISEDEIGEAITYFGDD